MKPTVGRIVHFYAPSGCVGPESLSGPYAALVTGVNDDASINLTTFGPTGSIYPQLRIEHADTPTPGCWNWPPRES